MVSLFDVLGPVMVGPSSSHTAGACRLGLMARAILGCEPESARILLHGSFAATGEGHGTHLAIVGGLKGYTPDDLRLRHAFQHAQEAGMTWSFEKVDLGDEVHPNTAVMELEGQCDKVSVGGASVGGGRIEVTRIDGLSVFLTGAYHTILVLADDVPGTIASISNIFAGDGVNLATMRVVRTGRRKLALMTIEADEPISTQALDRIRAFPWLHWARRIDKLMDHG